MHSSLPHGDIVKIPIMPRCPVCDEDLDVDQPALAYHVNGHFEGKLGTGVSVWAPNEPKRFQGGEDYEDPLDPSPRSVSWLLVAISY